MNKSKFIRKYKLKELSENDGILIELVYSTNENFAKTILYDTNICLLRKKTAKKLLKANKKLKKLGYKIKIWDAFRPIKYQEIMYKKYPDETFVTNPKNGNSYHCMASAVDITLCTLDNKELEMPTEFDHFGKESYADYEFLSETAKKNRSILQNIMTKCGFKIYEYEWWHFNDKDEYDTIYDFIDKE